MARGGGKQVCCCLPDHHCNTHLQVTQFKLQKVVMEREGLGGEGLHGASCNVAMVPAFKAVLMYM